MLVIGPAHGAAVDAQECPLDELGDQADRHGVDRGDIIDGEERAAAGTTSGDYIGSLCRP